VTDYSRSPAHIRPHSFGHGHPYSSSNHKTHSSSNHKAQNRKSSLMQLARAFRHPWLEAMLPPLAPIRKLLWLDVQLSWNALPGTQLNMCARGHVPLRHPRTFVEVGKFVREVTFARRRTTRDDCGICASPQPLVQLLHCKFWCSLDVGRQSELRSRYERAQSSGASACFLHANRRPLRLKTL
jgi:hypothetical protein